MVKKYILGIIVVLAAICIVTFTSASIEYTKDSLLNVIEVNNSKICQLETIQNNLHETADSLRLFDINDADFINELGLKWTSFENEKLALIQENAECQEKINKLTQEENSKKYLGNFELTAYCQGTKTSTGTRPKVKHTIAVDPKVIPYGSKVYIEGYGTYVAEDCGGAVKGNIIDIYMSSYNECIQFGRRKAKVYLIK